jgi:hypothetical protein
MKQLSVMQKALKVQWDQLPQALKNHYQLDDNFDAGELSIEYPRFMQLPLSLLRLFGVLINKRGNDIPTTVRKSMCKDKQLWMRDIQFSQHQKITFNTVWQYHQGNELIEYVNRFMGLRMAVRVQDDTLYYEGKGYQLGFAKLRLNLPEWLLLGHTSIEEKALDDDHFVMDFRLHHPLFGQVYRYSGTFTTRVAEVGAG